MNGTALVKASIEAVDLHQTLSCRFNPKEYTITSGAEWKASGLSGAQTVAEPQFIGSKPRSLQMELFFDAWDSNSGSVSADVDKLFKWTCRISKEKPRPPLLLFRWGTSTAASFRAYLQSLSARYTMFKSDGTPVRAHCSITLEEVPQDAAAQNPTSGGAGGERSVVVRAGDTLQSIAHAEYGKASAWRVLAEANRIDDPLDLPAGLRLLVPPSARSSDGNGGTHR